MKQLLTYISVLITISAQDAKKIIQEADKLFRGQSSFNIAKMTIVKPDWERTIEMKTWSKGNNYTLVLIEAPARDKGSVTLKRDQEIWNYIPSVDRVIKIPPSMMMQSWMGSDFTNDDLVKESSIIEDYTHNLIGDTIIQSYQCYKIELVAKEDAPVVWGKVITFVSKKGYMQLENYYYDEDDFLVKKMLLSKIRNMDGRTLPTLLEMYSLDKEGNKTIIEYLEMNFNQNISDSFFSRKNMTRIR
jgi:outer membrane lipoprotein-sorting protein